MYPHQLIGKMALRTKPVTYGTGGGICRSFMEEPVTILAATESHVVIRWENVPVLAGKSRVLGVEYTDNNWTSYDDLMELADQKHIELMQKLNG